MTRWFLTTCLLSLCLLAAPAQGQLLGSAAVVDVTASWDQPSAHASGQRVLAVVLDIEAGYKVNADAARIPAEASFLIPTSVQVSGSDAAAAGAIQWPELHFVPGAVAGIEADLPVFDGRAVVYVPVTLAADAEPGELPLRVAVEVQACDDQQCLMPSSIEVEIPLTIAPADTPIPTEPANAELFAGYDPAAAPPNDPIDPADTVAAAVPMAGSALGLGQWLAVLGLAFLGGTVLNIMPCVLPVIPIKILGLVQAAPDPRRRALLGLTMAAGVLAFWVGIGLAIASLASVTSVSALINQWWFNMGLGVLIIALAIGMCGLFSIRLPRFVYAVSPKHDSFLGAFGFGVMTAILATPCTGPFMGGAAGTVLAAGPVEALAVFAAIGGGMAWPYLLLSLMPGLVNKVPRTGPASELVKQVLGMGMLAAGAFFVGTGVNSFLADGSKPIYQWYWWVCGAIVAAAGFWLALRTLTITARPGRRAVFGVLGLGVALLSVTFAYGATRPSAIPWVYYTPAVYDEAISGGNVVVLDFTADWCINCKVLEATVLETRPVIDATSASGVVPMKVDLTGDHPAGRAKLNELGKVAIPVLAVIAPDGDVHLNAEVYTAEMVAEAIDAARAGG